MYDSCFCPRAVVRFCSLLFLIVCCVPVLAFAASKKPPLRLFRPTTPAARPQMVLQQGHNASVKAMAFSPDGTLLATGGEDSVIRLWDLRSGELRHSIRGAVDGRSMDGLAFSPDSKALAFLRSDKAELWDTRNGRRFRTLPCDPWPMSVAFSPDGKTLAVASSEQSVSFWNYRTGRRLRSVRVHVGEAGGVGILRFSADGSLLACACGEMFGSRNMELWNVQTGTLQDTLRSSDTVYSLAFSPDGKSLAVGNRRQSGDQPSIAIWNLETKSVAKLLTGYRSDVCALMYSPDGKTLISGDTYGNLKVWDVASGGRLRAMAEPGFAVRVVVSPDARVGAVPNWNGGVHLFDLNAGKKQRILAENTHDLYRSVFSPDGSTVLVAGRMNVKEKFSGGACGELVLWDTRSGNWKGQLTGLQGDVSRLALTPDGTTAVIGDEEGALQFWDLRENRLRQASPDVKRRIYGLTVLPDSRTLVVIGDRRKETRAEQTQDAGKPPGGSTGPQISFYDMRSGEVTRTVALSAFVWGGSRLAFSADGATFVVVGEKGTVLVLDVQTGALKKQLTMSRRSGAPSSVAISGDGKCLVVSGMDGIHIYDTQTGEIVRSFLLRANSLAFSPDAARIAAVTEQGAVRVWNLQTGRQIDMDAGDGYVGAISFSPNGQRLCGLDGSGAMHLWNVNNGKRLATFSPVGSSDWLVYTPEGYYEGSPGVEAFLRRRVDDTLYPASRFHARFHRPDRVQTALSGKPQPALYADLLQREEALRRSMVPPPAAGNGPERRADPVVPGTPNEALEKALEWGVTQKKTVGAQVKAQLAAGADPNVRGAGGVRPLMLSAYQGDIEAVRDLLRRKADIHIVDNDGRTALLHAASEGHRDVVRLLLDSGADLKDESGQSLLPLKGNPAGLNAALLKTLTRNDDWNTVRKFDPFGTAYVLLYLGADPNARDEAGQTPLMKRFAWHARSEDSLLQALLAKGADVTAEDKDGDNVLHAAMYYGNLSVIRLLLERGARAKGRAGSGALRLAADKGYTEIAQLLLEQGADPNGADPGPHSRRTALIIAITEGHQDIVRLLLEHRADVNLCRSWNWSPLAYAVIKQDATVVKLLLERGADVHVRTDEGKSLLFLSKERDPADRFGIAALLKKAGAGD